MDDKTPKKNKTFFKNYDLYSDANPKDTIRIKYKSLDDVRNTIAMLERLYKNKKYSHARISQVANVMTQRLRVINMKDPRYTLSNRYFTFLKTRTKTPEAKRRALIFKM